MLCNQLFCWSESHWLHKQNWKGRRCMQRIWWIHLQPAPKASKLEIFFCWFMMKNIHNCAHTKLKGKKKIHTKGSEDWTFTWTECTDGYNESKKAFALFLQPSILNSFMLDGHPLQCECQACKKKRGFGRQWQSYGGFIQQHKKSKQPEHEQGGDMLKSKNAASRNGSSIYKQRLEMGWDSKLVENSQWNEEQHHVKLTVLQPAW